MPYKIETLHIKLPKKLDRRIKLSDDQKIEVIEMFKEGISINKISQYFEVSRKLIGFIIYPDRLQHHKDLYKERRLDGRYYNKEKHTKSVRDTRRYRQENLKLN